MTEGNDEDVGGVVVEMTRELWSRGGNDREIESSGSEIGNGVAAGGERAGGVLEPYPSSPKYQKSALQYPRIRRSKKNTRTLEYQTVGEGSQNEGGSNNPGEHDFSKKVVKCRKKGNQA